MRLYDTIWYKHPEHGAWMNTWCRIPRGLQERLKEAAKGRKISTSELKYRILDAWAQVYAPEPIEEPAQEADDTP